MNQGTPYPPGQPQVGFAPQQYGGAPPQQQGYPPQQQGYPPQQQGYPPQQQGYPPQQQHGAIPQAGGFGGQPSTVPQPAGPSSAPPADMFANLPGYENVKYGSSYAPPPPPYEPPPPQQHPEEVFKQATAITAEQARNAMQAFVAEHCCYGKAPANDMEIRNIQPSSAYHYSLSTFCESRSTAWSYEPFKGQPVDGPYSGPAPLPWDIAVHAPNLFKTSEKKMEVPHTAGVKPCHECLGSGKKQCPKCAGRGRVDCGQCHGKGRQTVYEEGTQQERQCTSCHGDGRITCHTCHADGRVTCKDCEGHGQLKTFIELTVKWINHEASHVVERTDLPDELIVNSQGTEIFSQELPRVWPISTFHDRDINMASKRLTDEHAHAWPTERIIMQRHHLRAVPVSEVQYEWKDQNTRFWVYGHDKKVHAPDYPQQCCCGCVII